MNKIIITVASLLLLGTLTAALINNLPRQDVTAPQPDIPADPAVQNVPLVGTTWIWDMIVDGKGEVTQPEDASKFQLTFMADGTLKSTTDCNGIGGQYSISGEVLSVGSLVATQMFCEGSLEQTYVDGLSMVGSHLVEGEALTLILLKDAGMMSFSAKR